MSGRADSGVVLAPAALDRLMPFHLLVSPTGHITHAGPTIAKLARDETLVGQRFLDAFEPRRPRGIAAFPDLAQAAGEKLVVRLRRPARTDFKGIAVPVAGGGLLVNLSFGISAAEAVAAYRLTSADFPPTDLTVEMLYLVEAKEAVLDESRSLNRRLQGAKIAAEEQAFTDTLTGLKNRRAMDHILERYVEADLPFSVMHVDLDWFKQVNDTHGHAAGDHVLQVAARILVDETRADDTVIRAGGDEFLLIFPRLVRRDRLAAVAGRILSRLDAPIPYRGAACRVSASIGIASRAGGDALSAEAVVAAADAALYRSKKAGRARFSFAAEDAGGPSPHAAAGVVAPEAAPEDARPASG